VVVPGIFSKVTFSGSTKYGGSVQWPKSRSVYISDPNGYEIELAEIWGGGLDVQA
jgi:lactoylglutathione lyase